MSVSPLSRTLAVALTALALLILPAPSGAQPDASAPPPISWERFVLDNGLEVLMSPDPASRVVTSVVVVDAGSNRENPRTSGAAHFLEHMLFNGTERRTQKELYDETDAAGGFNNAFTRRTHAAFMMTMPADHLRLALDLQADMLFASRLPLDKFEKERGIILEELAKDRESESYQLGRLLDGETYPRSSYGLPVLGTEQSLRMLQRAEVLDHYQRLYVPQNMVALLIGGFDPDSARAVLAATFGAVRASGDWIDPPGPPGPIRTSRVARHDLALSHARLRMVWNAPPPGEGDFRAAQAGASLLAAGVSSDLGRHLAERFPGSVLEVFGSIDAGPGFARFILDVELTPGTDLDAVREALLDFAAAPPRVSPERLASWKVSRSAEQIYARQRSYMFAPLVSEDLALFGAFGLEKRLEAIDALDAERISSVFASLLAGPSWSIQVATTRDADAPGDDALPMAAMGGAMGASGSGMPPAMMRAMAARRDGAGEDGAASKDRPGPQPAQEARVAPEEPAPYPVDEVELDNGAHLLLLRAPADGSLSIYVLIEGRNYLEPAGKEGITELLHALLPAGAGDDDETALASALDGVGAEMQTADRGFIPFDDYYTRRAFSFVRLQALESHAERTFELLGVLLREPHLDEKAVERERESLLARLRRDAGSAGNRAGDELRAILLGADHPEARSPYGSPASVATITQQDLRDYHRLLLDPRRIWLAVVTSLPVERVRAWAADALPAEAPDGPHRATLGMTPERYELWQRRSDLGDRAAERFARLVQDPAAFGVEPAAGAYRAGDEAAPPTYLKRIALGGERGYVLETVPAGREQDPGTEKSHLEIAAGLLSSRLAFEMREERGMAYGIGAGLAELGQWLTYRAGAGTRLENVPAMAAGMTAVRAEGAAGVADEEIRRTASKKVGRLLRQQEMRLNQAMFTVWSLREGKAPHAWWTEATDLQAAPPAQVRSTLAELARAPGLTIAVE